MAEPNEAVPAQVQVSVGPSDKFLVLLIDDETQQIKVIQNRIEKESEVMDVLYTALGAAMQKIMAEKEQQSESRIHRLPAGSRLSNIFPRLGKTRN